MKKPVKLNENLFLIDDFDLQMEQRTGTYVLTERDLTIIETSASPSIPYILDGLNSLGYSPQELKYIIVTHIHLDHAGGAGLLLQHCPNATVIVHPKGLRHLVDPSRLMAGARAVYREKFDELFHPIIPINKDRIRAIEDKQTLQIGEDCILHFYNTPGHANHHYSILHSRSNGVFTGDTAGVSYPQLLTEGIELFLPTTSPNQFDPMLMRKSIALFQSLEVNSIYFGHYGMSTNPLEVYHQVLTWLDIFVNTAEEAFVKGSCFEEKVKLTANLLYSKISSYLTEKGIAEDHDVFDIIKLDVDVCSMGLMDYLHRVNTTTSLS